MDLTRYKTLVFDCDGVIMNSNATKTQAYFNTALSFGANQQQAQALVDYHVLLGGISRFIKFEYFLREILHQEVTKEAMQKLLALFGNELDQALLNCELTPGLQNLREAVPDSRWLVVSGGDQTELRTLFARRGIDGLFEAGIFGSPDNKDKILARELANGNLALPAIFLGDSQYDHEAAMRAGLDFVFVSAWTEFKDWQQYCAANSIAVIERL